MATIVIESLNNGRFSTMCDGEIKHGFTWLGLISSIALLTMPPSIKQLNPEISINVRYEPIPLEQAFDAGAGEIPPEKLVS